MKTKNFNFIILLFVFIGTALNGYTQSDSTAFAYQKPLFEFDGNRPVFKLTEEQEENKSRLLRFSILTGYREGIAPVSGSYGVNFSNFWDKKAGTAKLSMFNLSIEDMLTHGGMYKTYANRVILEVKDPSKYRYDPKYGSEQDWLRKNGHCFELLLPVAVNSTELMNKELSRVFKVKFGSEKRMTDALVLVRTSDIDKIKSAGSGERIDGKDGNFKNTSIKWIGQFLNSVSVPPFVDETGYQGNVDLQLNIKDWNDIPALRKELQRYDLDLKPEKRELDMFVIRENDWEKGKK